jgi:hypothetical protein
MEMKYSSIILVDRATDKSIFLEEFEFFRHVRLAPIAPSEEHARGINPFRNEIENSIGLDRESDWGKDKISRMLEKGNEAKELIDE